MEEGLVHGPRQPVPDSRLHLAALNQLQLLHRLPEQEHACQASHAIPAGPSPSFITWACTRTHIALTHLVVSLVVSVPFYLIVYHKILLLLHIVSNLLYHNKVYKSTKRDTHVRSYVCMLACTHWLKYLRSGRPTADSAHRPAVKGSMD